MGPSRGPGCTRRTEPFSGERFRPPPAAEQGDPPARRSPKNRGRRCWPRSLFASSLCAGCVFYVSCTFCYGVLGQGTQVTLPEKGNVTWMWGGHPDPAVAVGSRHLFTSLFVAAPLLACEPVFSLWLFLSVDLSIVHGRHPGPVLSVGIWRGACDQLPWRGGRVEGGDPATISVLTGPGPFLSHVSPGPGSLWGPLGSR